MTIIRSYLQISVNIKMLKKSLYSRRELFMFCAMLPLRSSCHDRTWSLCLFPGFPIWIRYIKTPRIEPWTRLHLLVFFFFKLLAFKYTWFLHLTFNALFYILYKKKPHRCFQYRTKNEKKNPRPLVAPVLRSVEQDRCNLYAWFYWLWDAVSASCPYKKMRPDLQ